MISAVRNNPSGLGRLEETMKLLRGILSRLRLESPEYLTPRTRARIAAAIAVAEDVETDRAQP